MGVESIITEQGEIEFSLIGIGKPILFIHGGHSNCLETLCHKGFDLHQYQ